MLLSNQNEEYYFGYGSNLSYNFLLERLKNGPWTDDWHRSGEIVGSVPERVGIYALKNYKFGYNLSDENNTETWANVQWDEGSEVYGLVTLISKEHLEELDRTEDVPRDYQRVALTVQLYVSEADTPLNPQPPAEVKAWVYIGNAFRITQNPQVDPAYETLILNAARQENLPNDYIEHYLTVPVPVALPLEA